MPNDIIGSQDYAKPLNLDLLEEATTESRIPTTIYTEDFYTMCMDLVREEFGLDLFRDITIDNSLDVYCFLVDEISTM